MTAGALMLTGAVSLDAVATESAAVAAPDSNGLNLGGDGSSLLTAETEAVAPGLDLTSFRRVQGAGWVSGHVMVADLSTPTLSLDVLDAGTVSGGATVSEQISGTGAVAAVNGDYFDMNASVAPVSTNVSSTQGIRTASPADRPAFTMNDGLATVQKLMVQGTVEFAGGSTTLSGINTPSVEANRIGLYTSIWGSYPLNAPIGGATDIAAVSVVDGLVSAIETDPAALTQPANIPSGTSVLVGRGTQAVALSALSVGDPIVITTGVSKDVDLAVSGNQWLVADGVQTPDDQVEAARTAVGVSRDGSTVYVVAVDGRAGDSRGLTVQELGRLMLDLGAWNAINLDGGGSTTMLARTAGNTEATVVNRPSDGNERIVANSLAFFSSAPAAQLSDVMVAPALKRQGADTVLPGLHRTLTGTGLDANLQGIPAEGAFAADSATVSLEAIDGGSARVLGVAAGQASVNYTAEGKTASSGIRVLGELQRITADKSVVALQTAGQTGEVRLTALDGDGNRVPVEVSDASVQAGEKVSVVPNGLDSWLITPTADAGSATITFTVGGRSVDVAVTIGYDVTTVADFSNGADWKFASDRAAGTLTPMPAGGPNGEDALRLQHDFTTSTATRGSYAVAPAPIQIPGQPQALSLWIKGDGSGIWPRIQLKSAAGVTSNLDGPMVTWNDWQQVRFTVPVGTAYPIEISRVRFMETRTAVSYQGDVSIAGLEAIVPASVDQPASPYVHDPIIAANGTVDGRAQRIAVMSDAQFVGRNPDSVNAQGARKALREIVAENPDLLVINGDFVDEAADIDFELAERILDEEVGSKLPWIYVPGNHEVMGAPISNFEKFFGAASGTRDLGSTRIITLNSSAGTLRGGGMAQLNMLEAQLKDAASDAGVTGVMVFFHHPSDDPLSSKDSQLGDRYEAAALNERFATFRKDTGKSIAVINGHVGVFHGASVDGVSQIINGNSGKGPAGAADHGGFVGWTLLGVNPRAGVVGANPDSVSSRINWMQAETRPRVDELRLDAPTVMTVGETASVASTLVQDGGREVPVAWPVTAQWAGEGVTVVDGGSTRSQERAASTLRLNTLTGELTATQAGTAMLSVTVNGVRAEVPVTVAGAPVDPVDPTDPTDPTDPVDPTDPTGPTDPTDPSGPGNGNGGSTGEGSDVAGGSSDTGAIATTGFAAGSLGLGGAILLLAGAALVVIRRRKLRTRQ
ncbi:calcineurin-like phosphoesterase family protein [Microterricola gilva]|uniref:Calcineurin-like phosphoesterase family protein n=1 Tax=Microterricola gilva TaxID=393267 RepID=A0A4Q8ALP3_9MICO|nr:calcineurin-like phosphoesterase family protein [Microterricola gilva]